MELVVVIGFGWFWVKLIWVWVYIWIGHVIDIVVGWFGGCSVGLWWVRVYGRPVGYQG